MNLLLRQVDATLDRRVKPNAERLCLVSVLTPRYVAIVPPGLHSNEPPPRTVEPAGEDLVGVGRDETETHETTRDRAPSSCRIDVALDPCEVVLSGSARETEFRPPAIAHTPVDRSRLTRSDRVSHDRSSFGER